MVYGSTPPPGRCGKAIGPFGRVHFAIFLAFNRRPRQAAQAVWAAAETRHETP